jgi:hypothetical protein
MKREPIGVVAISREPGAITALRQERKMFEWNKIRKPPHRFVRIHLAIVIHEQAVVY